MAQNSRRHWIVLWCDWRGQHAWQRRPMPQIGGLVIESGPVEFEDFPNRQAATAFIRKLRREAPADELVVQLVTRRPRFPEPLMLPGSWPWQVRNG